MFGIFPVSPPKNRLGEVCSHVHGCNCGRNSAFHYQYGIIHIIRDNCSQVSLFERFLLIRSSDEAAKH